MSESPTTANRHFEKHENFHYPEQVFDKLPWGMARGLLAPTVLSYAGLRSDVERSPQKEACQNTAVPEYVMLDVEREKYNATIARLHVEKSMLDIETSSYRSNG